MASSAFTKAMAAKAAAIQKMNEVEKRTWTPPKIDDGEYTFSVTSECGVTDNKGAPFVKFIWSIQDEGEFFGKGSDLVFWTDNEDDERQDATMKRLSETLMVLLELDELNLEDAADLEHLIDMVNADPVYATGKLKNWGPTVNGKSGINVYFKKRVHAEVAA